MAKKEYGWASGSVPRIAPHSLAKHRILREYIRRYLQVLLARPGIEELRLTLVDGFAGGGEYLGPDELICPGSPQILIDAVRESEVAINASRNKPVRIDAQYIFVEKNPIVRQYLGDVLRRREDGAMRTSKVQVLGGAFESNIDSIIAAVQGRGRARRVIFVLDQYGYTDVPISILIRIFESLPNAEVFLTLAVGWITAYLPNAQRVAEQLGLSSAMIERLRAITEEAFDIGDPERRPDLLAIQQILHHTFTSEVGSRFYTPFFIVSRKSNRPYWFLHMANSLRANDVVKSLHWEIENHFQHFGRPGLVMLGYDPDADPNVTRQQTFLFDDEARVRTVSALLGDLPRRIRTRYDSGVSFGSLFHELSNETPATRVHLAQAVSELCVAGEFEKVGVFGQRRANTTLPHDDDIVRIARQRSFSFPKS